MIKDTVEDGLLKNFFQKSNKDYYDVAVLYSENPVSTSI